MREQSRDRKRLRALRDFSEAMLASVRQGIGANKRDFLIFVLLSLVYQFISNASLALLFLAVGVSLPVLKVYCVASVIFTVLVIPISINGLGLREGLFVSFARFLHISPEAGVSVSLLIAFVNLLNASAGGIVYLRKRTLMRSSESDSAPNHWEQFLAFNWLIDRAADFFYEFKFGIRSAGVITTEKLGLGSAESEPYQPVRYRDFYTFLETASVVPKGKCVYGLWRRNGPSRLFSRPPAFPQSDRGRDLIRPTAES